MKIKKNYVHPEIEVVEVWSHGLLDSLSMGISDTPAWGGGDAKQFTFDEETESSSAVRDFNAWED